MRKNLVMILLFLGCISMTSAFTAASEDKVKINPQLEKATFAGGCFWCMEAPFDKLPGVVSVTVG